MQSRWLLRIILIVSLAITGMLVYRQQQHFQYGIRELSPVLPPQETRYKGKHVEIVSPLDPRLIRTVLRNADAYINQVAGVYFEHKGKIPLTIYLTRSWAEAADMAARRRGQRAIQDTLGMYFPGEGLAIVYYDGGERGSVSLTSTLFHEMTHHFVELNFPDAPHWFNEGLAGFIGDGTEIVKGRAFAPKLDPWNEQWASSVDPDSIDIRGLRNEPLKGDRTARWMAATQGRMLFRWLGQRGLLDDYLRAVGNNDFSAATLERVAGVSAEAISADLRVLYKREVVPLASLYWGMRALNSNRRIELLLAANTALPENKRPLYELAKHLYLQRQGTAALAWLEPLLSGAPNCSEYRLAEWLAGQIELENKKPEQALPHFFRALDFSDDDENQYQLYRALGRTYYALGDEKSAQQWLGHASAGDWSAGMRPDDWSRFTESYPELLPMQDIGRFRVVTTLDPRLVRFLCVNAEAYLQGIRRYLGEPPEAPITLYFMRTSDQVETLLRELDFDFGYDELHGICFLDPSQLYLHYEWGSGQNETMGWGMAFDQLARLMIIPRFPGSPIWFRRGLAGYFGREATIVKGLMSFERPSRWVASELERGTPAEQAMDLMSLTTLKDERIARSEYPSALATALFRWLGEQGLLDKYLERVRREGYGLEVLATVVGLPPNRLDAELRSFIARSYGPEIEVLKARRLHERGLARVEEILRDYPDHPVAMEEKMMHLAARGKQTEAIQIAEELLQKHPTYPGIGRVLRNEAASWRFQGNIKEAIRYFLRALDFYDYDEARYQIIELIGECYSDMGDRETAASWLRLYLKEDWEPHRHAGLVRLAKQFLPEYKEDFEAVHSGPTDFVW